MSDGGSDEADDEADGQRRREKAQLEDEVRALQEAKAEAKAELERLRAECRRLQESCFHARTGTAGNIAGSTAGSRSGGRRDSLQVGQSDAPASRAIDRALADARAAVDALRPPLAPRVSDDGHEGEQWSVEGWSASLGLDKLLAARLCAPLAPLLEGLAPPARSAAQLAYVRSLGSLGEQSAKVAGGLDPDPDQPHPQPHPQPQPQHIMEAVLGGGDALAEVASLYAASSARLGREFASVEELLLSSKYVQEGELYFSTLSAFNAGLDATIGSPHPKLQESMEGEHTAKADSCKFFTAGNYGITTQSRVEWFFVVDPSEGLRKLPKDALPTGATRGDAAQARTAQTPLRDALAHLRCGGLRGECGAAQAVGAADAPGGAHRRASVHRAHVPKVQCRHARATPGGEAGQVCAELEARLRGQQVHDHHVSAAGRAGRAGGSTASYCRRHHPARHAAASLSLLASRALHGTRMCPHSRSLPPLRASAASSLPPGRPWSPLRDPPSLAPLSRPPLSPPSLAPLSRPPRSPPAAGSSTPPLSSSAS